MSQLDLQEILKSSYLDKEKQKKELAKHNYLYDSMLSNGNQQIYYNPQERKLLNTVAGTHNLSDWGTDLYLAAGHLKDTNRYKDADRTLKEAKKKYGVDTATVVGHSLGGSIGQGIASANDQYYGLNAGYTVGQKSRSNNGNFHHLRTEFDIVSGLGANSKNMKTLQNKNNATGFIGTDILRAHDINTIKNNHISI